MTPTFVEAIRWSPDVAHPLVTKELNGYGQEVYYIKLKGGRRHLFEGAFIVTWPDDKMDIWCESDFKVSFVPISAEMEAYYEQLKINSDKEVLASIRRREATSMNLASEKPAPTPRKPLATSREWRCTVCHSVLLTGAFTVPCTCEHKYIHFQYLCGHQEAVAPSNPPPVLFLTNFKCPNCDPLQTPIGHAPYPKKENQ